MHDRIKHEMTPITRASADILANEFWNDLQIDYSADGKLDLMELLDYIGLKSSSFARRVGLAAVC